MENLIHVARYIYDNISSNTDKKVQKITYYAYCWYILKNNKNKNNITKKLFEQYPEAWIHGPVFYDLYQEMSYNRDNFLSIKINLQEETKSFLNQIIEIYGKYTGNQLEAMTHNETPWQEAREGLSASVGSRRRIKDEVIFSYFSE